MTQPENHANCRGSALPSALLSAPSRGRSLHGKEGSTVRVHQRALQKSRKAGLSFSDRLALSTTCSRYGADYGAFRSARPLRGRRFRPYETRLPTVPANAPACTSSHPASPGATATSSRSQRVRDECLNINMFWSLAQARVVISDWKADSNHRRRHSALGYQAPAVYAAARTSH